MSSQAEFILYYINLQPKGYLYIHCSRRIQYRHSFETSSYLNTRLKLHFGGGFTIHSEHIELNPNTITMYMQIMAVNLSFLAVVVLVQIDFFALPTT